jgi:2-dehydropantoate 2-reductase
VVGPGAIGVVFAAAVQEAGRGELVLCARRRLDEVILERDNRDLDRVVVEAPVLTDPSGVDGPAAWVLLAVKVHQTEGASAWLEALTGPESVVVVLQNGVEHLQRVAPLVGEATVLPAIVWCPAEASAPGRVRLRGEPRLTVPAGPPGEALAELMAGSARIELVDDFTTEAWRKLCINAVAGLMVLTGRRAGMFREGEMAELARGLALECLTVARAEGAQLPDRVADKIVAVFGAMPADLGSSILFDRQAGRPLEWDASNGVVRRVAARHGIPTPISDVVVPLLAAASDALG